MKATYNKLSVGKSQDYNIPLQESLSKYPDGLQNIPKTVGELSAIQELSVIKEFKDIGNLASTIFNPEEGTDSLSPGNSLGSSQDLSNQGMSNEQLMQSWIDWLNGDSSHPNEIGKPETSSVQINTGTSEDPLNHIHNQQSAVNDGSKVTVYEVESESEDGSSRHQEHAVATDQEGHVQGTYTYDTYRNSDGDVELYVATIQYGEHQFRSIADAEGNILVKDELFDDAADLWVDLVTGNSQPSPTDDSPPPFTVLDSQGRPLVEGDYTNTRDQLLEVVEKINSEEQDPLQGFSRYGHESVVNPGVQVSVQNSMSLGYDFLTNYNQFSDMPGPDCPVSKSCPSDPIKGNDFLIGANYFGSKSNNFLLDLGSDTVSVSAQPSPPSKPILNNPVIGAGEDSFYPNSLLEIQNSFFGTDLNFSTSNYIM